MPGKADKTLQNSALQSISEQEKFMIRVLFICHGNICRSPIAEFVFKDMVSKRHLSDQFIIASAATSEEEIWNGVGNPVYPPAREELRRHGLSCEGKRAIRLRKEDYDRYDYLIGMDSMNIRNMLRMTGGELLDDGGKIVRLMNFTDSPRDVADPWYTGDFRTTYEDISEGLLGFLRYLGYEQ